MCLAKWQMSHVALLSQVIDGYKWFIWDILWWERCPSLKCQMVEEGITLKDDLLESETLQRVGEILLGREGWLEVEACTTSLYKPFVFSPKPIIFLEFSYWIVQLLDAKFTIHERDSHNLETEMRLSLKEGQYKTWVKYRWEVKDTMPAWSTITELPLGKLTYVGLIL